MYFGQPCFNSEKELFKTYTKLTKKYPDSQLEYTGGSAKNYPDSQLK